MLATQPNAKRKFRADNVEPFDFDVDVFPSPIHDHKRARLSQHRTLAKDWRWGLGTATADDEHRRSITAALSFSCRPWTSFPDTPIPADAHEDNERAGHFLSTVSTAEKDMPAMKRPRLVKSSDAGNGSLSETLELEGPQTPQIGPLRQNKPRRPPFPGENPPRLRASWRETTSSKGAENPYSVRNQENGNNVTASKSNASSFSVVANGLETGCDYNVTYRDLSLGSNFSAVERQQTVHTTEPIMETPHNMKSLANTEVGQSYYENFDLSAEHATNLDLPLSADSYIFDSFEGHDSSKMSDIDLLHHSPTYLRPHLWSSSGAQSPTGRSGSTNHETTNTLSFQHNFVESSSSFDTFDSSHPFMDFNFPPPGEGIEISLPTLSEIRRTMEGGNVNLESHGTQFDPLSLEDNISVDPQLCVTHRNLEDYFSNFGLLGSPFDDQSLGFANGPYFPQSELSTSLMSSVPRTLDALGSKTYDDSDIAERGPPPRNSGLHSQPCRPGEIDERQLQNSTDICLTYGIASQDMIQDENITGKALSPRTKNLRDAPAEIKPPPSSRFSTKVSNLNSSRKSDSPILLVDVVLEKTNDTQQEVQEFLAKANQPSKPSRSRNSGDSPSQAASDPPSRTSSQKLAKRTRPLSEETRAKAKEMRKLRSCLRCRASKIACTTGEICGPCSKVPQSLFSGMICVRAHLKDYLNLFLPEQAIRPFQKASLDYVMDKKISGFRDGRFEVYLSSGPCYTPIPVTVGLFHTQDSSFSFLKEIVPDGAGKPTFVKLFSLPLGITDFCQDLPGKLTKHIEDIVEGERNIGEVLYGNTSRLTWDVHEAVRLYWRANPTNQLLRKALMLYAMQFFMTKTIVLLREESQKILQDLPAPMELNIQTPNLRMINIQIKHVMYTLIRDKYLEVLEELEKDLRPKDLTLWAPNFCCILILCMCAEMVQITSDYRVVCALDDMLRSNDGLDKNGKQPSRVDSLNICRELDELALASAESNFHMIYKSIKLKEGLRREQGFNPIRDGVGVVRKAKLGREMEGSVEELVVRIHDAVIKHGNEMRDNATLLSFNGPENPLESHTIFRKHNSGRLVSKFLQSML